MSIMKVIGVGETFGNSFQCSSPTCERKTVIQIGEKFLCDIHLEIWVLEHRIEDLEISLKKAIRATENLELAIRMQSNGKTRT